MQIVQAKYKQEDGGFSNEPLKVNNVGYYKEIGYDIEINDGEIYEDYLIIYNYKGKIDVYTRENVISTNDGTIIIIPPGVVHHFTYYHLNGSQYYWCHFSGTSATELIENCINKQGYIFQTGSYSNIGMLFNEIYNSMVHENNSGETVINNFLYTLLFALNTFSDQSISIDNEAMDILKAIMYIQNNFNKDISIEDLSKICNSSKYNFMRKFKSVTGSSVHKFLVNYRIMHAQQLLLNSDMNIKEISDQVGFADNMYFSKAFKKYCGITPTEYKNNFK